MKQLILGGARSGKSQLAETLALATGKQVIYIATTDRRFNDGEMDARIQHHQQRRPAHWQTVEAPRDLAQAISTHAAPDTCLLVDCLTLWVTNCLLAEEQPESLSGFWSAQREELLDTLPGIHTDLIMVSNEVGWGIVPMGELSRRYVDEAGFLHQAIASRCERVVLTAAGLPLVLKGEKLKGEPLTP